MTNYPTPTWMEDHPVVLMEHLPDGTRFLYDASTDCTEVMDEGYRKLTTPCPVIVVAWPDGSEPRRPVKPDVEWLRGMVGAYELAMSATDGRDDDWLAPRAARYRAVLDYIDSIGGEG